MIVFRYKWKCPKCETEFEDTLEYNKTDSIEKYNSHCCVCGFIEVVNIKQKIEKSKK